jgi:DNA-binding transcriptional LysR family regulator
MTAAYVLPTMLDELRVLAPDLEIEIVADNDVRDLLLREADIAVRHVRPEQASLMAKRINEDCMRFYATDTYVHEYGTPILGKNTASHQFVSFGDFERVVGYLNPIGLDLSRDNFRYTSNSQLVEWEIARNGRAIAIMTDRIAKLFPEFRPVLTEVEPFQMPMWLVAHRELQTSRRIRLVFDLLSDRLGRRKAKCTVPG